MRELNADKIIESVARLCQEANYNLGDDVLDAFFSALEVEPSITGKEILQQLIANARIASSECVPMCQDTGLTIVMLELGQDLHVVGGDLYEAVNEGVRKGYKEGYLRCSIVSNPIKRKNTGDNTPAVIHCKIVPGDRLKITVMPKGGGSENMSGLKMLTPADGADGVKKFVLEQVKLAGPNPCPPTIIGIGIGGSMEKAAMLSKEALLRPLGQPHESPDIAKMEAELLEAINRLGIGPQGLGGRTTSLSVHIEVYPCHIASLPVAVNINCHAHRHKQEVL